MIADAKALPKKSGDLKLSVLTVGDEILAGEVFDSNFPVIAQEASVSGFNLIEHRTVGDDIDSIARSVESLSSLSEVVIVTGGLGPTSDDVTAAAVAKAIKRRLKVHEETANRIKAFFRKLNRTMPEENLKQALVPEGSHVIEPAGGTAPGFIVEYQNSVVVALPGVPSEMKMMLISQVMPYLQKRFSGRTIRKTVVLRVFGSGESDIASMLKEIESRSAAKFGYIASEGEILVKLTASGTSEEVETILEKESKKVRDKLGIFVYAEGEEAMEEVLGRLLLDKKKTISVAESCTAGMLASRIANVPGSSNYFLGGIVAYRLAAKKKLLEVPESLLSEGAVSEEVARAMAGSVRMLFQSDLGIGVTGVAGPGKGGEKKPVGTVCIALSHAYGCESIEVRLPGSRMMVRNIATLAAMNMARIHLLRIK